MMSPSPKLSKNPLKKKTRCIYKNYNCSHIALPSFSYCIKHILEDKNAPYKQCSFVYSSNGEKCHYAVPTLPSGPSRENILCTEHAQEYEANRLKPKCKYFPPLPSADTILSGLSHYVKTSENYKRDGSLVGATADELLQQIEKDKNMVVNPFVDIDPSEINSKPNETLNFSCEIDSDLEPATSENVWENADQDSSDAESLDLEMSDLLRHAGVYTDEEMVLSIRNHAVRLQNLCIQQYRRLLYLLREKKARYLTELKREKEIYGPVTKPQQMTLHDKKQYDQLRALARYQKIGIGPEALLFKKMLERRKAVTPGLVVRSKNYNKCTFTEGGVKCLLRVLPATKHCRKHILNDRAQVLFQACGVQKQDHTCREPIVPIPIPNATCTFHFSLPKDALTSKKISKPPEDVKKVDNDDDINAQTKIDVEDDTIKEEKLNLSQDLAGDSLDLLLNGCPKSSASCSTSSSQPQQVVSDEAIPTSSQIKPIADDLDISMTDKLFEDITKNLKNEPFMDALENYFKVD